MEKRENPHCFQARGNVSHNQFFSSRYFLIFFLIKSCCFINELLLFCKDLSFARVSFYLDSFTEISNM